MRRLSGFNTGRAGNDGGVCSRGSSIISLIPVYSGLSASSPLPQVIKPPIPWCRRATMITYWHTKYKHLRGKFTNGHEESSVLSPLQRPCTKGGVKQQFTADKMGRLGAAELPPCARRRRPSASVGRLVESVCYLVRESLSLCLPKHPDPADNPNQWD